MLRCGRAVPPSGCVAVQEGDSGKMPGPCVTVDPTTALYRQEMQAWSGSHRWSEDELVSACPASSSLRAGEESPVSSQLWAKEALR